MPFFTPSVTTEADAAFTSLTQQCNQLKLTALGLTDEQARSTPTASGLSIAGLIVHGARWSTTGSSKSRNRLERS